MARISDGNASLVDNSARSRIDPRQIAKSLLTSALPYRVLKSRALKNDPVTLLCYHTLRPDNEVLDAWTALRVSDFVRQIAFIREHYDIVSLDAAFDGASSQGDRPRAVLTFDDGEVGLFDCLLPLVRELKLPVTLYIATGQIESGRAYWFDEVMNALQGEGPFTIDLPGAGLKTWRVSGRGAARWATISDILQTLKDVPPEARPDLAAAVIAQAPAVASQGTFTPLGPITVEQLRELAQDPLVTIAAHSHCHNLLDQIAPVEARESIARSRQLLEEWTGQQVRHFAYPNGNHNPTLETIVSDLGFTSAVALDGQLWHRSANTFALPRVSVGRYDDFARFKLRLAEI